MKSISGLVELVPYISKLKLDSWKNILRLLVLLSTINQELFWLFLSQSKIRTKIVALESLRSSRLTATVILR